MRTLVLTFLVAACSLGSLQATPIAANFINAELPPNADPAILPYLLKLGDDTLFLRFKVPDIGLVSQIDSFNLTVTLFDDGDGGGESGHIQFALPGGPNLDLTSFTGNINGSSQGSPINYFLSLDASQIAQVLPSMQDGNFRIRVLRDSGDFLVASGSATIDATLVPEPSTLLLGATALGGLLAIRRRKRTS